MKLKVKGHAYDWAFGVEIVQTGYPYGPYISILFAKWWVTLWLRELKERKEDAS